MFKLNSTHKRNGFEGLDALTSMRADARNGLIAYGDIYDQLADWGDGQEGVDRASIEWLRGAADVNRGEGVFSDFIRDYTNHQHFLRYGRELTAQELQTLSNNIAENVITEILNSHNNPSLADIPTLSVIGQNDAKGVIDSKFDQDITAWSGVVLFPFLGDCTFLNEMLSDTNATSTYRVIAALDSLTVAAGGVNPLEALQLFGQMVENYLSPGFGPSFPVVIDVAGDLTGFVSSAYGRDDYLSNFFANAVLGRVGNHADTLHLTEGGNVKLVHGGPGDDMIIADALSGFGHIIDGGDGEDKLDLSVATSDLEVTSDADSYVHHRILFDGGIFSEDTVLVNTEHLLLGSGDDNVTINQSIASSLQNLATGGGNDVVSITSTNLSPALEVDLGSGDDEFAGGNGNEIVTGGTGNDTLTGGAGNDFLNGGEGLNGGGGDDSFQGLQPRGAGDDILNGGQGDDRLEGGAGNDTYLFVTGDGVDRILDADRAGSIVVNGTTLAGQARYVSGNQWALAAGGSSYTLSYFDDMQTLAIARSGQSADTILVEGFDKATGGLGITLEDTDYVPPPQGLSLFAGSGTPAPVTWLGTPGSDAFYTWVSAIVYAGDGEDNFYSNQFADYALVYGGGGDDGLGSAHDNATLFGGAGNDQLSIIGNSYADGGDGDDYIWSHHIGGFIFEYLSFVDGENPESIRQALIGGAGIDTLGVVGPGEIYVDLRTGTLRHEFDARFYRPESDGSITGRNSYVRVATTQFQIVDFENVEINYVLRGNKTIIGDNGNNVLTATGNGLDTSLFGGEGNDTVTLGTQRKGVADGGSGNDILNLEAGGEVVAYGGSGDDTLNISVAGEVTADGGAGNDTFSIKAAYKSSSEVRPNNINGGAGYDTVSLLDGSYYYYQLRSFLFGQIVITEAEELIIRGTRISGVAAYDEWNNTYRLGSVTLIRDSSGLTVTASAYPEISVLLADWSSSNNYGITLPARISGTGGADVLTGTGANDRLDGGAGADSLLGDAGNDSLDGGSDTDWLNFTAATQAVTVDLQNGSATGFFGTDQVINIEAVLGGTGADSLLGDAGSNTLHGGASADTMAGGAGNDLFFVTDAGDLVMELAGGGADTIISSTTVTLPNNVEALRIAEGVSGITITGGAGNDMLIGNGLANSFNGGAGDDVILAGNVTLADIHALFAL